MAGLKIRYFGNAYCVCDGVDKNDPNAFAIGTRLSRWFDTWEEAFEWRKQVYKLIAQELFEDSNEYGNPSYEEASVFLKNKYE